MSALTDERIAAAMADTDEFTWIPWGYLLDDEPTTEAEELDVLDAAWVQAISERTQYVPLVEREAEVAA
jgi:hypothetical protein